MCDPFLGEVKMCAFNFAPQGWALCNGAVLQAAQNQALNALLGNLYGGDGRTTFGLPDLQGRTPVHRDYTQQDYLQGAKKGAETVVLTAANMPSHTHALSASSNAGSKQTAVAAGNSVVAASGTQNFYGAAASLVAMNGGTCATAGGSAAHNNMQPSLVVNFVIATAGLWPPRD